MSPSQCRPDNVGEWCVFCSGGSYTRLKNPPEGGGGLGTGYTTAMAEISCGTMVSSFCDDNLRCDPEDAYDPGVPCDKPYKVLLQEEPVGPGGWW